MFAEIAQGHRDVADVLLLIAAIVLASVSCSNAVTNRRRSPSSAGASPSPHSWSCSSPPS
jgi:hypothetical protein